MQNDLLIYSNKGDLKQGMFGQVLIWLLECLYDLEKQRIITDQSKVVFHINAQAYDNIIPTFIHPLHKYTINDLKDVKMINMTEHFTSFKKHSIEFNEKSFAEANRIWNKYFVISDDILSKIPEFDGSKTLGIHYRGTDKNVQYNETNNVTQDEFIDIVIDYVSNNDVKYVYCCSDEASFINNLKNRIPSNITAIEYIRASTAENIALHRLTASAFIDKHLKDNLTISAFVDMLALSRCHTVLKTNSALSSFSKIINPGLQLYTVGAMKEKWFPTGLVKPYETKTKEINAILARTMQGHMYF
jgi:hypothetical protein